MRKITTLLTVLFSLVLCEKASAQLSIGNKSEGAKQLITVQQMWAWLYENDGHVYYVCKTDNQFDSWIWLDLGQNYEEAAQTTGALIDALEAASKGDTLEIDSRGEKYLLSCDILLGARIYYIHPIDTRNVYAGVGPMNMSALKKALKFLKK